ncbi:MAG: hypothetical protein ACM4D3_13045 [Candidatus Sericytochromatia bacterium]
MICGTPRPSLAISAGVNPKAVQTMLGHASAVLTLDTYADLFPTTWRWCLLRSTVPAVLLWNPWLNLLRTDCGPRADQLWWADPKHASEQQFLSRGGGI